MIALQISFILVVTEAGGGCCKLLSKAPQEDEGIQDATASLAAAAEEINAYAAVAAGLSELGGIFILNQERGTALKAFPWCKRCFNFTADRLWREFSYTCSVCGSSRVGKAFLMLLKQLPPG